jgi:Kef-type K+ transport system membrane component KefB
MVDKIFDHHYWPMTLVIIFLLCSIKILSTMFATFFFGMRSQDSFALGLLLNTKGAIALIMLNIAWDRSVLIYFKHNIYPIFFLFMAV